ncbi:MAG: hypothetical protein ABR915_09835 [Thermoguttaceae bacterium]|jgi:hypothetical protein
MALICPNCSEVVRQDRNVEGLNYCPHCRRLFFVPPPEKMPPWILGVLVILVANWQLMVQRL